MRETPGRMRLARTVMAAVALSSGLVWAQAAEPVPAWHRYRFVAELPDPPDPPSPEAIAETVSNAQDGDWAARQQLATVYLYEVWRHAYWNNRGCELLPNGYYCRALAAHGRLGQAYLMQIINLAPTGPIAPDRVARFQADYAWRLMLDARPRFAADDPICAEVLAVLSRAVTSEIASPDKHRCTARDLGKMYGLGQCTRVDESKARALLALTGDCPQP